VGSLGLDAALRWAWALRCALFALGPEALAPNPARRFRCADRRGGDPTSLTLQRTRLGAQLQPFPAIGLGGGVFSDVPQPRRPLGAWMRL